MRRLTAPTTSLRIYDGRIEQFYLKNRRKMWHMSIILIQGQRDVSRSFINGGRQCIQASSPGHMTPTRCEHWTCKEISCIPVNYQFRSSSLSWLAYIDKIHILLRQNFPLHIKMCKSAQKWIMHWITTFDLSHVKKFWRNNLISYIIRCYFTFHLGISAWSAGKEQLLCFFVYLCDGSPQENGRMHRTAHVLHLTDNLH